MSWQNILSSSCSRYKRKISQSRRSLSYSWRNPYEANGNHTTKPSTVGHVISKRHWKCTFNFTEIINNYWLKRCQILRFISQFFLKLYIQSQKHFHSMVLGSVGRRYCRKNRVLEFLTKTFWLGCQSFLR